MFRSISELIFNVCFWFCWFFFWFLVLFINPKEVFRNHVHAHCTTMMLYCNCNNCTKMIVSSTHWRLESSYIDILLQWSDSFWTTWFRITSFRFWVLSYAFLVCKGQRLSRRRMEFHDLSRLELIFHVFSLYFHGNFTLHFEIGFDRFPQNQMGPYCPPKSVDGLHFLWLAHHVPRQDDNFL